MSAVTRTWGTPSEEHALLLRAALLDGDRARDSFTRWRRRIDPMALDEASFRLLPLLAENLIELGVRDSELERWKGTYRRAFAQNAVLTAELAAISKALASARIEVLVLGAVDDDWIWPVDALLVASERAVVALCEIGYAVRARHSTSWRLVAPSGREVILRRCLLDENRDPADDAAVWRTARTGRHGRRPSAANQLVRTCVEGQRRGVASWAAGAYVLAESGEVDWAELVAATTARRLALPLSSGLRWIREELDAPVPPGVIAQLEASPVSLRDRVAPIIAWGIRRLSR